MKKLIIGLLSVMLSVVMMAASVPVTYAVRDSTDDFEYTVLSDGTVGITKYYGNQLNLQIPSTLDGLRVTRICKGTFTDTKYVTKVILPSTVSVIESKAFYECPSLTEVVIPGSVKEIQSLAFAKCYALRGVTMDFGVESIGKSAFKECSSLETIKLPKSVRSIGDYAFLMCINLKNVQLSPSCEEISYCAFAECDSLEKIVIPEGVKTIRERAFFSCDNLQCVVIPSSVKTIENFALNNNLNRRLYFSGNRPSIDINNVQDYVYVFYRDGYRGWGGSTNNICMPGDVSFDAWYCDSVGYALSQKIMNGTGNDTFSPDATTDRAMLVTVLWRLSGKPKSSAKVPFTDLKAAWYRDAVAWAYEKGIVEGTSSTTFSPTNPVTREQTATILYRYSKHKGYDVTASAGLSDYPDTANVSAWATTGLSWACGVGLISGTKSGEGQPTMLTPKGEASRAQIATILKRYCENVKTK